MAEKVRVLLVDDEDDLLNVLRATLHEYEVEVASGVDIALEKIAEQNFDVVITDIRMPQKTGYDLIKEVRRARNNLPFVLISGHEGIDMVTKGLQYGAVSAVEKPFSTSDLIAAIQFATRNIGARAA